MAKIIETPVKTEQNLCVAARAMVFEVYCFLKREYETMQIDQGSCCDISYLGNLVKRTALATNMSIISVRSIIVENVKRRDRPANRATSEYLKMMQLSRKRATWGRIKPAVKAMPAPSEPAVTPIAGPSGSVAKPMAVPSAPAVKPMPGSSAIAVKPIARPSAPSVKPIAGPSAPAVKPMVAPSGPAVKRMAPPSGPTVKRMAGPALKRMAGPAVKTSGPPVIKSPRSTIAKIEAIKEQLRSPNPGITLKDFECSSSDSD